MSVWGTGREELARGFSRQHRIIEFAAIGYASRLRHCRADLPTRRSSDLAIRAGRNLPDKEFRYLRMVIVTTAVYWGLNSQLRLAANRSS